MRVPLALLGLLLAGCLEPTVRITDPWPVDRPGDWDQSAELVAYDGFRAHSADQTVDAAPRDAGLARPAGCAAYQDGRRDRFDTCAVVDADRRAPSGATWTVHATWDGSGEDLVAQERDEGRRSVVAYAADGTAVAHLKAATAFTIE
jgi:hypothetical protein